MANGNGQVKNFDLQGLDHTELLMIVIEALQQLTEQFDLMQEVQADILEKVNNLTLDDSGYTFIDE